MDKLKYSLLTDEQRALLPEVIVRRNQFKRLIDETIIKRDRIFANGILISGKPGTGKTTMITEFLEQLIEEGKLAKYDRISGHVTKLGLYNFMKPEFNNMDEEDNLVSVNKVHLLDDVDCLGNYDCLEVLKAALDTKSTNPTNRVVFYTTGTFQESFKYQNICIIITNNDFSYCSEPQQALLDRVHLFNLDLSFEDFVIFNLHIIEDYLNNNPDTLPVDVLDSVADLMLTNVTRWFETNAFQRSEIHFSIRLIRKFVDLMLLVGNEWKNYSVDYKELERHSYKSKDSMSSE
jgi:predicted AAA+ superfamily ATPase